MNCPDLLGNGLARLSVQGLFIVQVHETHRSIGSFKLCVCVWGGGGGGGISTLVEVKTDVTGQ